MARLLLALALYVLVRESSGVDNVDSLLIGFVYRYFLRILFFNQWSWLPKLTGVVWPKDLATCDTGAMIAIIGIVAIVRIIAEFLAKTSPGELKRRYLRSAPVVKLPKIWFVVPALAG
ncbi:MAG: hypothetical protein H6667_22110 [Ardenticatenaceae bacterium]|nr:hypothetical protein [Ardenticatenaceae bacterium]